MHDVWVGVWVGGGGRRTGGEALRDEDGAFGEDEPDGGVAV